MLIRDTPHVLIRNYAQSVHRNDPPFFRGAYRFDLWHRGRLDAGRSLRSFASLHRERGLVRSLLFCDSCIP